MSQDKPEPTLDFSKIRFPSDRWTILHLRKCLPQAFDVYPSRTDSLFPRPSQSLDTALGDILDGEREYAELVFREVVGIAKVDGGAARTGEVVESLLDSYARFSLLGEHEAKELLREVKAQASEQAKKHLGRSPS